MEHAVCPFYVYQPLHPDSIIFLAVQSKIHYYQTPIQQENLGLYLRVPGEYFHSRCDILIIQPIHRVSLAYHFLRIVCTATKSIGDQTVSTYLTETYSLAETPYTS